MSGWRLVNCRGIAKSFLILLIPTVVLLGCRTSVMVPPSPPPEDISYDQLVRRFEAIVFYSEFSPAEGVLLKRTGSVTWRLMAGGNARARASLLRVTKRLSELTGLSFQPAATGDTPVLEVIIEPRADLVGRLLAAGYTHQGFIYDTLCWGQSRGSGQGMIERLIVSIPNHLNVDEVETCLWIEITQGLGLPNDLDDLHPSIYSDGPYLTVGDLPWYDAILVRTLYDHRLRSGMTRNAAMPFVRIIIKELLAERNAGHG